MSHQLDTRHHADVASLSALQALPAHSAHVSLADRLSLRLGLWLLLRSARVHRHRSDREAHARLVHSTAARAAREHAALRDRALGPQL